MIASGVDVWSPFILSTNPCDNNGSVLFCMEIKTVTHVFLLHHSLCLLFSSPPFNTSSFLPPPFITLSLFGITSPHFSSIFIHIFLVPPSPFIKYFCFLSTIHYTFSAILFDCCIGTDVLYGMIIHVSFICQWSFQRFPVAFMQGRRVFHPACPPPVIVIFSFNNAGQHQVCQRRLHWRV